MITGSRQRLLFFVYIHQKITKFALLKSKKTCSYQNRKLSGEKSWPLYRKWGSMLFRRKNIKSHTPQNPLKKTLTKVKKYRLPDA